MLIFRLPWFVKSSSDGKPESQPQSNTNAFPFTPVDSNTRFCLVIFQAFVDMIMNRVLLYVHRFVVYFESNLQFVNTWVI